MFVVLYFFSFRLLKFFLTLEMSLVVLFCIICLGSINFGLVYMLFFVALFSSEASLSFSVLVGFLNKESFSYVKSNSFGSF